MGDLAVAAGVNPVGTGMDAWSKMLGIQQQRQQLQTGAYQQQSAQAQAQQQQIQAQEMQAVRSIFSNPPTKADGTIDQDAVTQAVARSAPNFGLPRVGELIDTAQKGLNFKKSTLGLTSDLQNETRQIMGAWAADPKPNVSDLASNLDTWARQRQQTYPGVADYKNDALALISKLPTEQRRQMALLYSQGGMPMQQTVGPGGVAIGSNGTIDTGKQVKVGTFAPPQQGGGFTQSGPAIDKQLAPTDQPDYVARRAAAATGGAGGATSDNDAYNTVRAEGTNTAAVRSLSKQVIRLADEVNTGSFTAGTSKFVGGVLQRIGASESDLSDPGIQRQVLGKVAAQLKAKALQGAHSPEARQAIEDSFPDPDNMQAGAVKEAARYVDGNAALSAARLNNAERFRQNNNGSNIGLSRADSQFMLHADPFAFHYSELPVGPQRQEFIKDHFTDPKTGKIDEQAVRRFVESVNVVKHNNVSQ